MLCGSAPTAAGSSSDGRATHAYLIAQYKLFRALLHQATAVREAERAAQAQIARECPGVLSGMPQPLPERLAALTPRARGEKARLANQQQTIETELVEAISGESLYRPAEEAYAAEVHRLSWSDPTIASLLQAVTDSSLEDIPTSPPSVCAELRLSRILGFPNAASEEPRKQILLGSGRTAAGTHFAVNTEASGLLGALSSCHRSIAVSYSRPGDSPEVLIMGGPNNPICLSPPHERHPALFCEEGIETIQTAVPASVSSVRLVLADGRRIESRVVHVPPREGGPEGIYAQELRGSTSHAVSLVELSAGKQVVLTLDLPRYRCVKPRGQQPELPISVDELATGHTPEGEPFTIDALGTLEREPFLSVDAGVNPELNEITVGTVGPPAPKAFPWSLSIGCAPHPYAILYGFLAPPGDSVTARTPEGAVGLTVVPSEPRLHAKGPLVYGVFRSLPSELTVVGSNGSTVYAENLQAQARQATEFCEGYGEG